MKTRTVVVEDVEVRARLLTELLGGPLPPVHVAAYLVTVELVVGEATLCWVQWKRQPSDDGTLWLSTGRSLCPVDLLVELGIVEA